MTNRRKKRSLISLLLLLFLTASFLFGCTTTPEDSTSEPEGTESTTKVPEPEEPRYPIPEKPKVRAITVRLLEDESTVLKGQAKEITGKTVLLSAGQENNVSFTVTAAEAGLYAVDLSMNRGNGFVQYFHIRNLSFPEWGGEGQGRFGNASSTPPSDISERDYSYANSDYNIEMDSKPEAYVYLKKGENVLQAYIDGPSTNTKLGIRSVCLIPEFIVLEGYTRALTVPELVSADTSLTPIIPSSSSLNNNGYFLRAGARVYIDVEIKEDATYLLTAAASTSSTGLRFSSPTGSFLTTETAVVTKNLGDCSTTVLPIELARLEMKAGKHTIQLDVTGGYLHMNALFLEACDFYDPQPSLKAISSNFTVDRATGAFALDLDLNFFDPNDPAPSLSLLLEGDVEKSDGTRVPLRETYPVLNSVDTVRIVADGMNGAVSTHYTITLYNQKTNQPIEVINDFTVRERTGLRVLMLTDWHYCGSNETQMIYNYSTGRYEQLTLAPAHFNAAQCDIYGNDSEKKMMQMVDELKLKYEAGEFDLFFLLGDSTMNDGNYDNFFPLHINYQKKPHYGESLADFWTHPLNQTYMLQKKYLTKLSEAGIPYYLANGNHDYLMQPNKANDDLDFSPFEALFHYQELFGHKKDDYIDATPVDYLVRVVRRDGKVRIVTSMTEKQLAAFREEHAADGDIYGFYLPEESLTESDERLAAFIMVNGHQWESFKNYYEFYTTQGSWGQTIRYEYLNETVVDEMTKYIKDYPSVYFLGHMVQSSPAIAKAASENPNIRGIFYGDAHYEVRSVINGLPAWCVGHRVTDFDIDKYYVRDPNTGELTSTPDNQYYYDRGNPKVSNQVWGDFSRHPYCHMTLEVDGTLSYAERNHYTAYYENGFQPLTKDWVRGWDPNYLRAGDNTLAEGTRLTVGNRTVYVGSDATTRGTAMAYIGTSYTANAYNEPAYLIQNVSGNTYGVYTLSGAPVMNGTTQKTVAISSYNEGTAFQMDGKTYYVLTKIASVYGHYYYDETGEFVYERKDGGLAFYDFYRDKDGKIMKEYFYLNTKNEYVPLGEWNADHSVYTLKDGVYTDIRLYNATTDGSFGKGSKYEVTQATIEIKNGVIVRGEGFMNFSYTYRFVDEYGNEVKKEDVKRFDDKLGIYIPQESYLGENMIR